MFEIAEKYDENNPSNDNFINKPQKSVVSDIEPIGDELSDFPDRLFQRAKRATVLQPLFERQAEKLRLRELEKAEKARQKEERRKRGEQVSSEESSFWNWNWGR